MKKQGCMEVRGTVKYFNGTEWKEIRNYTGEEEVLICNADGSYSMEKPWLFTVRETGDPFYHIALKSTNDNTCGGVLNQTGNSDLIVIECCHGEHFFVRYKTENFANEGNFNLQALVPDSHNNLESLINAKSTNIVVKSRHFTEVSVAKGQQYDFKKFGFGTSSGMVVLSVGEIIYVAGAYYK